MINIKKIFSVFNSDKEQDSPSELYKHPFVISGTVYKSILQLDEYVLDSYKSMTDTVPSKEKYEKYYSICQKILFDNCHVQLQKLNLNDTFCAEQVMKHPQVEFLRALNTLLYYFENEESYEKCNYVLKFINEYKNLFVKSLEIKK